MRIETELWGRCATPIILNRSEFVVGTAVPSDLGQESVYTWKELPQPQVDFTWGLLNLNPAPSSVST